MGRRKQRISDISADEVVEQTPPSRAGVKVPLNDEAGGSERRQTMKNSMLANIQRKRLSLGNPTVPGRVIDEAAEEEILAAQNALAGTPRTPSTRKSFGFPIDVGKSGSHITPLKRAPLVVNFEEWMKMANDNVGLRQRNA